MATRIETQRRREDMRQFLRDAAQKGSLKSGEMVPPVRELAARFELSVPVALEVVKGLAEEGVLTTIPSVGTFVGRPAALEPDLYLLVYEAIAQTQLIGAGFEERISQLGGVSLIIDEKSAHTYFAEGIHPNVAGVFRTRAVHSRSTWEVPNIQQVEFGLITPQKPQTDMVYFDNVGGGEQATQHLLKLGHKRIAFLGLHGQDGNAGNFVWSREREDGWRSAMEGAGLATQDLTFCPPQTIVADSEAQIEIAEQSAKELLKRSDITGIVATNSFTARGLFEVLQDAGIAEKDWPAVVTFDTYQVLEGYPATALRLPWEEIGKAGAELLWQRRHGQISGAPEQRLIPMRLISRLSCRPDWARSLGLPTSSIVPQSALPLSARPSDASIF